jgi:hypothetical protein
MKNAVKLSLALAVIATLGVVSSEPALARGGAASIMNSPGYQRRLQESRQQLPPADLQPISVVRHKSRHRH